VTRVSRNGIYFWPLLSMSMMVKGANRYLAIDPFFAFHKCLMLFLLWALLVVVYSNQNLLEEPRMWQGSPGMVYTFGPYYTICLWPLLYMPMMVKGANRYLAIDPFLAFHQCLLFVILWALLVVVYSNQNLLEEPRMWQGSPRMVYTFGPYSLYVYYDGQGSQPLPGHRSILGIPQVTLAHFIQLVKD
jgi:hypothetical protein